MWFLYFIFFSIVFLWLLHFLFYCALLCCGYCIFFLFYCALMCSIVVTVFSFILYYCVLFWLLYFLLFYIVFIIFCFSNVSLITYQQPVENLLKTRERNITTLFGNEITLPAY